MNFPEPADGDRNRGPMLLGLFWAQIVVSLVVVALRFMVRARMKTLGVEDWTILVTLVLFITNVALATVLVSYGLGRHIFYLSPDDALATLKWSWIVQPIGIMAIPFGKISVTLFLLRLMGPNTKWRKHTCHVNMAVFTIVHILAAIFSFVQCNPPRALWESVPGAKCWNPDIQANWAVAGSIYSSIYDFFLALLPITIVWNLKMTMKQKVGLCFLLGGGVICGIAAALKAASVKNLAVRSDPTWATVNIYIWGTIELFLNILCGSIPILKPLYDQVIHGRPISQQKGYQGPSQGSYELKGSSKSGSRSDQKMFTSVTSAGTRATNSTMDPTSITMERTFEVSSLS